MSIYITVFNLSVRFETDDLKLTEQVKHFISTYYTVTQPAFGNNEPIKVEYVSKIKNYSVWYFHSNQFKHLIVELNHYGFDLNKAKITDKRDYEVVKTDFKVKDKWKLREDQVPVNEFILDNPTGPKLIPLVTGSGKAQPLISPVKIPGGWSTMGEMKVGTIVTAKDGTPTAVNGVYPQGRTPVYKITFEDRRVTLASDEHLWEVFEGKEGEISKEPRIVTTLDLKRLTEVTYLKVYIDLCDSEEGEEVSLPLDPYLLGTFLGEFIDDYEGEVTGIEGEERYNNDRFLPEEYLHSSRKQRMYLINGLLDTVGIVHGESNAVSLSSANRELVERIQYLVRSVGAIAGITVERVQYPNRGEKTKGKDNYKLTIGYKSPTDLFRLQSKKDLFTESESRESDLKLRVLNVEYVGEMKTQCISINHPDKLYVTDDFIVTHNTFVALNAIGQIKERLGILILPTFIDKWVSDIEEIHEADKNKDLLIIQGGKSLAALIDMQKQGILNQNYLVFSARTLQEYVKAFEEDPEKCEEFYGCSPEELFPLLGIGIMLVDETHMSFHALYKITVHTNVKFHLGLSATLISDDPVVTRAHRVMYPSKSIYGDNMLKKYLDVYPIAYNIGGSFMKYIKTTARGSTFYSHTVFEQSILKVPYILDSYVALVQNTIEDYYTPDFMEKDKLIVFVATVALATVLVERLQDEYPDKSVLRYCEGDSYDEMLEGDFIITTVKSAGTGLDIPNLRVGIQTVSVSSEVSNVQTAGRLRYLKDRDVKFCYLYSETIPKQVAYHYKRMDIFRSRANNIALRRSPVDLT